MTIGWGPMVWLIGFAVMCAPMRATSVIPPEFSDLVNQSDYIVRATVRSVASEYVRPGSRKIVTKVELDIIEVVAGTPPQPLVLKLAGGRIGEDEMTIEGVPQFRTGEEYILFVQGNGRQIVPLVAMMHGFYRIEREADGRAYVARSNRVPLRDTAEVTLPVTMGAAAEMQRRMNRPSEALSPPEFIQQIRGAVKAGNQRLRER